MRASHNHHARDAQAQGLQGPFHGAMISVAHRISSDLAVAKVDGRQGVKVGKLRFVWVVAFIALGGCAVDRFDAASCRCVGEHPWPRSALEELQFRQCVLANRGDGPCELDETQCRLWLTSPWLKEPPSDDVAGRVLPLGTDYRYGGDTKVPKWPSPDGRISWQQDDPCEVSRKFPHDDPLPEAAKREQALSAACADMADTACRHRYLTEAVRLLRPHAEFEQRGANSVALPLFCGIRSDGSLDVASIGHHWWRLPAAKRGRAPPALAAEATRVDVGALVAEIRWMRQLYPDVSVRLAAQDDVTWGDYWAVWWAIDEVVTADRSDRHSSRLHDPVPAGAASATATEHDNYLDRVDFPTCREWHSQHRVVHPDINLWRGIGWAP